MQENMMEEFFKKFRLELKNKVVKIEDSSERDVVLKKIIKRLLEKSNFPPTTIKKLELRLMKNAPIYIEKFEKKKLVKQDRKEVEKENRKSSSLKRGKPVTVLEKPVKSKKKKKVQKSIEEEESVDPRFLKYISGEENDKFFEENKITGDRVEGFIDGLKKLNDESMKLKLFSDKEDIFMTITCFKIPKTPTRQLRLILPRMIVSPTDNILLIVKDISKGAKNTEKSEEYHKELLEKHNVKIKPEVMCLTRLRKEHDQFELKRKLVNSYETFLVDGRISGHLAHFLGKIFTKKRKLPTPIKMDAENLDEQITKGLRRTILPLHSTGDCYTLRIGTTNMPTKHITENFLAACTQIAKLFPGGWDNVRCIRLKTPLSMALPIYVSLKSKNKVEVTKVMPKRPKAYVPVEGELTTLSYHDFVSVTPEGKVTILEKEEDKMED